MIEIGTWIAIAILGPGALAVFVWFLVDLRRILSDDSTPGGDEG